MTPEEATWHRLNPRMLLIHPVTEVSKALPALLGVFVAGQANGNEYWPLGAAGIVAVLAVLRWFTTRLRITPTNVQLQKGLLRRETLTTSRDRIRTVDVTSHVLHRALGLTRVVIGTGTNDSKGGARLVLDGLTVEAADTLRDELLHQRVTEAEATGETELVRLQPRWIGYAPFTLSGVVTGLVLWGFYWRIQGESGVDVSRSGPLRDVSDGIRSLPLGLAIAVLVLSVIAFVAVTSTAGYVLSFWRFRLVRHESGTLQVTRGLLTTRATSIEHRRLVGTVISEPLVLRWVGAARLTAVATGLRTGRGSERGGEVLLPPAPRAVAVDLSEDVLDGTAAVRAELIGHPPAARRRRLTRALMGGVIALALTVFTWQVGVSPWVLLPGTAVLAVSPLLGLDRFRNLGHTSYDGFLVARSGSLVRHRVALQEHAIIGWNIESSWFQRRAGLVTLTATTAAGSQAYSVFDLDAAEALSLASAVTPELVRGFQSSETANHGDAPP